MAKYEVKEEFIDKNTREYFAVGAVYVTDSKERATELQEGGFLGEKVEETELDTRLKHTGGGYYELPNGEKIRGKDNAVEALKKLDEATSGDEEV